MSTYCNIALIGNPNCGKTTIFNNLTGSRQKVGNWPGVTVEKKSGDYKYQNRNITVTDLPGIYSLSPAPQNNSIDQQISNQFVQQNQADLYINILDATNLKRNLYLTLQLIALNLPCIIVINMIDKIKLRKLNIDTDKLGQLLNRPVIALSSTQNSKENTQNLKSIIEQYYLDSNNSQAIESSHKHNLASSEHRYLYQIIDSLTENLAKDFNNLKELHNPGYLLQILETDNDDKIKHIIEKIQSLSSSNKNTIINKLLIAKQQISDHYEEDVDIIIADIRYQAINNIYQEAVTTNINTADATENSSNYRDAISTSTFSFKLIHSIKNTISNIFNLENLDNIVLNKYLGIPVFLFILYSIFEISISFGEVLKPFFELTSSFLIESLSYNLFTNLGFSSQLTATITQGLATGFTTVAGFIPQITLMFILLTFLEDSGYMARAAFVMDRLMQAAGLPGKSFVPLIISFGCNVPAILSTRTLDNNRDRILTCLMSPFMSCSARLAIFIVFASAFFPEHQGIMVFLLYLTGIIIAILTGLLLKATVLTGKPVPFILELPSYNIPTLKNIFFATWQRCKGFIVRAGKLIIPICIFLQLFNSIQPNGKWLEHGDNNLEKSALAQISKTITPVLNPIGVTNDNWPATVGLITGSLAKEVVVGTLNTLYSNNNHQDIHNPTQLENLNNNQKSFMTELSTTFSNATQRSSELLSDLFSYQHFNITNKEVSDDDFSKIAFTKLNQAFPSIWAAFAYCLFVLLYMPCLSTFSILMKEIGKNWAIASLIWSLDIAYATSATVYQLSTLYSSPVRSLCIITSIILFHVFLFKYLKSGRLAHYFEAGKSSNNYLMT